MNCDQFYNLPFDTGCNQLEESSVQVVVADPPYGIAYHSNHYKEKNPHAPVANDWNFQIAPLFKQLGRILREGGAAYVFSRWDVYPLWMPSLISTGLKLSNVIVWVKNNHSAGDLAGNFGGKYEVILFLTKGRHRIRGKRFTNVWEADRVVHTKLLHPTQKPASLYQRAIEASSDEGDLAIDPCCGSGTIGEAARTVKRHFIGFDLDPKMIAISQFRLGMPVTIETTDAPDPPSTAIDNLECVLDPRVREYHPEDVRDFVYALKRQDACGSTAEREKP
jgi:site-specific DNA-methyltransferase (adenine-specific)